MTCSELCCYWDYSPNYTSGRSYDVQKITFHHMAGALSIEGCGDVFSPTSRQASSNYGIGGDGRIGMYVDEDDTAWTSASYWNDTQAITVEVANTPEGVREGTWEVSDEAWASMVALGADICRRYGFRAEYTGDTDGTLTEHMMFAPTGCPGPYIHARMDKLADDINAVLDGGEVKPMNPEQVPGDPVNDAGLWYRAHCEDLGWCTPVRDGQTAGTVGYARRLEAFKITPPEGWELCVKVHIANVGWKAYPGIKKGDSSGTGSSTNDPIIGTVGESKRIEAVIIEVTKRPADDRRMLWFRVHQENVGWKAWTPEGFASGTDGMGIRLEAIQMKIQ